MRDEHVQYDPKAAKVPRRVIRYPTGQRFSDFLKTKISGPHNLSETAETNRTPDFGGMSWPLGDARLLRKRRSEWIRTFDVLVPEPESHRHLLDYRTNIFARYFILSTKSMFVGERLCG